MSKIAKKYEAASKKVDASKLYSLEEAVKLVKETSVTKFDASVDISFRLNVNPTLADQLIRGTITLPHGNGKTKKVLVVTNTKLEEAKESGAEFFGGIEMLQKIQNENWFEFDAVVATPDMMGVVGRLGKLLGPKGLMPNPKSGTVTMDLEKALKEIKAGKVEYRLDKANIIHTAIGKVSFGQEKLQENFNALLDAIIKAKPAAAKGQYLKNVTVASTMGPGVKINPMKIGG